MLKTVKDADKLSMLFNRVG